MLRTKPLQSLLSQALSSNVHTAIIATPQGSLLAHAVGSANAHGDSSRRQARSYAAIASAIWKSYANISHIDDLWDQSNGDSETEGLNWTAVECEVTCQTSH
jgi:hypothetical protein